MSAVLSGGPRPETSIGLLLRELAPADRRALAFIFRHLGETSRYQRFLGVKHQFSAHELDHLTHVDHWHREALIAFSPSPRTPIGVARYVRCSQFDLAEVAITVVDDWQRRGVGVELLLELRERAFRAGIRRFTATMFRDNRGAIALAHYFGPTAVTMRYGGVVELSGSWHPAAGARCAQEEMIPACVGRASSDSGGSCGLFADCRRLDVGWCDRCLGRSGLQASQADA
jgi:RimJ/RimL family protein N-acetyltransferase